MPNEVTQKCPECGLPLETKMHPKATGRHADCHLKHLRDSWKQCDDPQIRAVIENLAQCVIRNTAEWQKEQDKAKEVQ